MAPQTYCISSQPFYDCYNQCYKNILTIKPNPVDSTLCKIVKKIQTPPLSPFHSSQACAHALYKLHNNCELMTPDDIPELINYLTQNNYKIDTSITKMMNSSDVKMTNKLICFITG